MSPRQTAIKNGDMFYEGRPCKRKGHTKRYVKGYGCVECYGGVGAVKNDHRT